MVDSKKTIKLLNDIKNALSEMNYGSIEIYVQNNTVTQITIRNIQKTNVEIEDKKDGIEYKTRLSKASYVA